MVIPSIRPPTEATRLSATTLLGTWGWGHILATILHSSTSTTWENIQKNIFSLNLKFGFEGNIPYWYSNDKSFHNSIVLWKTISSKERWLMIVCVLTAFVCHFVCDILDEILDSLGHWRHHQWQIRPDDNSCQSPISQSLLQLQICDGTCEAKIRPHYVRR